MKNIPTPSGTGKQRVRASAPVVPPTTAKEIMSTDVLKATQGMTVEEVVKLLVNSRITGLPVVDKKGKMVGVVSEYDVLVQIGKSRGKSSTLSEAAFLKPIEFSHVTEVVSESTTLNEIIKLFIDSKYRRLPVVNGTGRLVGIITRRDLMRVFYYRAKLS